ncbi:MAG: AGE family epimerase/isomerase [Spirosomataceae bacterium]
MNGLAKALVATKDLLSEKSFREKSEDVINELMKHFWEPRANILLENVFAEGGYSDCILGRKIHPGQVFEAFNTFYELTEALNDFNQLRRQLAQHVIYLADTTWDEVYGGYFQWLDIKSLPAIEPSAYFKLAWVHLEACTALLRLSSIRDRAILKKWQH